MRRIITYLVCGIFLFSLAGNLSAVEKKDKKSAQKEAISQKQVAPQKAGLQPSDGNKPAVRKRYDTFVDVNKNGIDDRRENLKAKPAAKTSKTEEEKKK